MGEIFLNAPNRIWCCLAQAANGSITHHLSQVFKCLRVPNGRLHEAGGFGGADTAWRTLPTAFMFKKFHHIQCSITRFVMVTQHYDCRRSNKATIGLQRVKVQRNIVQAGGQNTA